MEIDLKELLSGQTDIVHFSFSLDMDKELCPADITITDSVHVDGNVTNQAGFMQLSLTAFVPATAICARCLTDVDASFELEFVKNLAEKGKLEDPDNDDYLIVEDGKVDVVTPLSEQIWLEMPTRFLCKPDCKGLCPVCGKDRNIEECHCNTKEPDPRFDVLRQLLNEKE